MSDPQFFLSFSGKCFSASAKYSFELSSSFSRLQMYRFIMANANIHRIFVQKDAILQTFSTRIVVFRRINRKFFFISRVSVGIKEAQRLPQQGRASSPSPWLKSRLICQSMITTRQFFVFFQPRGRRGRTSLLRQALCLKIACIFGKNHIDLWPKSIRFLKQMVFNRLQSQVFCKKTQTQG